MSRNQAYKFPAVNSLTAIDEKYFSLIKGELDWRNFDRQMETDEKEISIILDNDGFPDSNGLTETDREYFNIVKTEDGKSWFFTEGIKRKSSIFKPKRVKIPKFRFHRVNPARNELNKKPIVGLFL